MNELIHLNVDLSDNRAHLYNVTLKLSHAQKDQQLSLPSWAPGSYMIREFAQHIVSIHAYENAQPIVIKKTSKNCFELKNLSPNVEVKYQVYAFDSSIRAAFLDDQQAFFNGTALFLRPHGFDQAAYLLSIKAPADPRCSDWEVATGMEPVDLDSRGFGSYVAQGYEALVDYPFQISAMKRLPFSVKDIAHEIVLVGDVRGFDQERLIQDLTKLCKSQMELFGNKVPFDRYLFISRFEEGGAGGLEHRNSSMLLSSPHGLPKTSLKEVDNHYRNFLALCSHEYFHAWNVKRLKPKNFVPINFENECYTTMLWIFEGLTSYYDDLMLKKAGLISTESYLEILSKNYSRYLRTKGRFNQSIAQSSFDAWIKFYRPNENSNNATISYYLKGSFIGLMLDLIVRQKSQGALALDDIMREAFELYGDGSGFSEDDFFQLLAKRGVNTDELKERYIYGVEELPVLSLLAQFGVEALIAPDDCAVDDKTKMATYIGCKIRFDDHYRAHITTVDNDGPAMEAGLCPHDEILAIDNIRFEQNTMADILGALRSDKPAKILCSRKKVLRLYDLIPRTLLENSCKLVLQRPGEGPKQVLLESWLNGL